MSIYSKCKSVLSLTRHFHLFLFFSRGILLGMFLLTMQLYASTAVAVDASGSMRGFFATKAIQGFVSGIQEKKGESDVQVLFFHEEQLIDYDPNLRRLGQHTYLDRALNNLRERGFSSILLVTDNLQSEGDDSDDDLQFYDALASEDVEKVYIVPLFLDFNGRVETPSNSRVAYRGERGLLCYLIKMRDGDSSEFEKLLKLFPAEDHLLIKPITQNEIHLLGVAKPEIEKVELALKQSVKNCNVDVKGIKMPNVRLENNGRLTVFDKKTAPQFHFDKKNSLRYFFNLESRLQHINIGKDGDPCDDGIQLHISNLSLMPLTKHGRRFFRKKQHSGKRMSGKIVPPHFIGKMTAGGKSSTYYYVEVEFGPYKKAIGINNFYRYLSWSPIPVHLSMDVRISIPPKYFSLTTEYREKYFTDTNNDHRRIFSSKDIVTYINQKSVDILLNVTSK